MILQTLTYGTHYTAIEHTENDVFHFLQLKKQKKGYIIFNRGQQTDLHQIVSELSHSQHLFVVFNTEQVLVKKINESHINDQALLRLAFPNIVLSDFYYEIYQDEQRSFVAIARKKYIDQWIDEYQKSGVFVIDFSLGNLAVKNLQKIVTQKSISTSNAVIVFNENQLTEIRKESTPHKIYHINGLEIANTEVLALAGIVSYFSMSPSSPIYPKLKELYTQKRFFELGIKTGLGFLLVILLINFLFYNSYREHLNKLTEELEMNEQYKTQLSTLQKKVVQKKELVESLHSATTAKVSKYLDEIGKTTPETILLSRVNYQPLNSLQRREKVLVFEKNKLLIQGACLKDEDFSNWVAVLESKDWFEKMSISEYGKGKKRGNLSNFEFEIILNE